MFCTKNLAILLSFLKEFTESKKTLIPQHILLEINLKY